MNRACPEAGGASSGGGGGWGASGGGGGDRGSKTCKAGLSGDELLIVHCALQVTLAEA
jgi:hypothetical protein